MASYIIKELRIHAPFTFFGAISGIVVMALCHKLPYKTSYDIFYILHPSHVFLSALVTASMYKLHKCGRITGKCIMGKCNLWSLLLIGYVGSVGIATLSDSIIPYLCEVLFKMPNRGIHIGFIEKWWIVNPLAIIGIAVAYFKPKTKFTHAGHVLLSVWASLFHIIMALGQNMSFVLYPVILVFLFVAVLVPCCV
ncbi:MAG: hypothetical protein PHT32_02810, partial [Candidatus Omnitrophica bacterium]|nr:hypothetical protein [Candidatus Omnitrophota bacterium]